MPGLVWEQYHRGGCSGRCDAVVGAVEAQKANTLHVHFKFFIQRAHQFMTLAQIAALLQDGILHSLEFTKYNHHLPND